MSRQAIVIVPGRHAAPFEPQEFSARCDECRVWYPFSVAPYIIRRQALPVDEPGSSAGTQLGNALAMAYADPRGEVRAANRRAEEVERSIIGSVLRELEHNGCRHAASAAPGDFNLPLQR